MTPESITTPRPGELLVAIMNDRRDMAIARDQGWYRIPVRSAHKWLKDRWPPQWFAFYQTKVFDSEKYAIIYYAKVFGIQKAVRETLFPNEPPGKKSGRLYYKLQLGPLQTRSQPITSLRRRRIVFIPTTWQRFASAMEINDLYDENPLENRLWSAFKRASIHADRQWWVRLQSSDFAQSAMPRGHPSAV